MADQAVRVIGAEVRAIRNSSSYSFLMLVEGEDEKTYTRIHSVSEDREALLDGLTARADTFGVMLRTPAGSLKKFKRGRNTPGYETTGIVRGWMVDRHERFGIQAWASMEIETKWGPSNVPVLIDEQPLKMIVDFANGAVGVVTNESGDEVETQEPLDLEEAWGLLVQDTVLNLSEKFPLRGVWPIKVGYHGKYELAPTARENASDEPAMDVAGGSQLPEVTAW